VNLKISGIIAGIAFVLSLLIGFISGAGIFVLVRALIFAAVFFGISEGAYWLILRFLPELLEPPDNGEAGSLVDISIGDDSGESLPEVDAGESGFEDPSGLDQKDNIGYTDQENMDKDLVVQEDEAEPALLGNAPELLNELPDLESLSSAFSSGDERRGGLSEFVISSDSLAEGKPGGSNKPGGLNSEFNTQNMASAIQTILKRE
jgi:hypothetical protein